MLHILLLILKWIGIIVAAILGILVLLICIVLFVPLRYEVQGRSDGDLESLKGKLKVTWLLHLFRADVYYKGKRLKWRIRLAFFKRSSGIRQKKGEDANEKKQDLKEPELVPEAEVVSEAKTVEHRENTPKEPEKIKESVEETHEADKVESEDPEEVNKTESEDPKEANRIFQKIQNAFQKIKYTFQDICARIKKLGDKKEKLAAFVTDATHRAAFAKAKKVLFWYLKKIKPQKAQIQVRYGFEDPYHTGQMLAFLSVLYPFLGEYTEIIPDFEQRILKGTLYVKGRIRASHLVHLAWKLFWDKNIRASYADIKNFKL